MPDRRNYITERKAPAYDEAAVQAAKRGKITLIGCPKLDDIDYSTKLTEIIRANDIQSITAVRMELPCCGGLEMAAKHALHQFGCAYRGSTVSAVTEQLLFDCLGVMEEQQSADVIREYAQQLRTYSKTNE